MKHLINPVPYPPQAFPDSSTTQAKPNVILRVTPGMVNSLRTFMLAAVLFQIMATCLMVILLFLLTNDYLRFAVIGITFVYSIASFHMVIHQWRVFMARILVLN